MQCIIIALIACVLVFVFIARVIDVVGNSMYEAPSDGTIERVVVTAECVKSGSQPLVYRKTENAS